MNKLITISVSLICSSLLCTPVLGLEFEELQMKPKAEVKGRFICLSDLIELVSVRPSEFPKEFEEKCLRPLKAGVKEISKSEVKQALEEAGIKVKKLKGSRSVIQASFKRIPFVMIHGFAVRKLGESVNIQPEEDVLVPEQASVFFEIQSKEKKFYIRSEGLDQKKITYKTFAIVRKKNASGISEDKVIRSAGKSIVKRGNRLSLFWKDKFVEIKFLGEALDSGDPGDIIRVRSIGPRLIRNFRARIVNSSMVEIIP